MPRLKRAQKLARREIKPAPKAVVPGVVAQTFDSFYCPLCGMAPHEFRAIKAGYVTVDHIRYFASIDWDPNKPFGVRFEVSGRGSLRKRQDIGPEDSPGLFEEVKTRFLQALREWLDKGWITREELP